MSTAAAEREAAMREVVDAARDVLTYIEDRAMRRGVRAALDRLGAKGVTP